MEISLTIYSAIYSDQYKYFFEELQELKEAIREVDNINNEEIELKQLENTEEPWEVND